MASDQGYLYLDVRSEQEFELGHPAGAFNLPWQLHGAREPNPRFIALALAVFGRERGLIVSCQVGQRSSAASEALLAAGFTRVVEQHAGYAGRRDAFGKLLEPGWERAGLPTSMHAEPGRSYQELCAELPAVEPADTGPER
jgi:rhodanese-related sulfurtransferase